MSDSSRPPGLQPTRLLRPWDFPGKSTGVGCHCHCLASCNMTSVRMCFIIGYSPLRHGLYVFTQSFSLMEMEPSKQTPTETFRLPFESVDQFLYLLIRLEAKAWNSEDTLYSALPLNWLHVLGQSWISPLAFFFSSVM